MHLNHAYQLCEKLIKQHSTSFHKGFSVLPESEKNAVWAVYAFCRTVDDIVDEDTNLEQVKKNLARFSAEFEQFLTGNYDPNHFAWVALADVFARYPMDPEPFRHLIDGQRQDLWKHRYETMEELEHYCYLVAGTVGLMLLPILAPGYTEEMREKAIRLGYAMQITNILRDVAEDYRRGRIYLPQEWMKRFNYQETDIPLGVKADGWKPLFDALAEKAEQYYEEGLSAIHLYPRSSRLALAGASLIYREILKESQRRGGDVFSERVIVSNWRKMMLVKEAVPLITDREKKGRSVE